MQAAATAGGPPPVAVQMEGPGPLDCCCILTFEVLPAAVHHVQGFCMIYDGLGEGPEGAKDRTHFTLKPLGPGQKYSFRIRVGGTETH